MAKFDFGKVKGTLQGAAGSVKEAAGSVKNKAQSMVKKEEKPVNGSMSDRVMGAFDKNRDSSEEVGEGYKNLSIRNAIKIIYFLMSVDGKILHSEEDKFDSICEELDPDSTVDKERIIDECKAQMDKVIDIDDLYDVVQDGVEEAVLSSENTVYAPVLPKLILWDLLTVAYSDEDYDESERKLIKYYVRKTNINKSIFLEMENSILTLMDLEKELDWIKTTDRQYQIIQKTVDELELRRKVILDSVKDLITL